MNSKIPLKPGDQITLTSLSDTQKKGLFVSPRMETALRFSLPKKIVGITSAGNYWIDFGGGAFPVCPSDCEKYETNPITEALKKSPKAQEEVLILNPQTSHAGGAVAASLLKMPKPGLSAQTSNPELTPIEKVLNPIISREDLDEEFSNIEQAVAAAKAKGHGYRFNKGKLRWRNFPMFLMRPLAEVGQYGETKYATYNFLKGMPVSDTLDCLMRHLDAVQDPAKPDIDDESKCHHLAHVAWNALVALHFIQNKPHLDDRFRPESICPDALQSKDIGDDRYNPEGEKA